MILWIEAAIFIWEITAAKRKRMADKSEDEVQNVHLPKQVMFFFEFARKLIFL